MIKPVPSVEPDYTRCRAVVLFGSRQFEQCSLRPVETRQHTDGTLYRVCRRHKRARWFEPWTAKYLPVSEEELFARGRRAMELLPPFGPSRPPPKLVR
jgi:hypothetical protein